MLEKSVAESMAQNKNGRKSEGLCQKIHNAVSPFRSRIRRISHQPHKKPLSQTTENCVTTKMIPVEFEPPAAHFSAQNAKNLIPLSPVVQSVGKEKNTGNAVQEFGQREIAIVSGQKFAKATSRKKEVAPPEKVEKVAPFVKAKSKKEDDDSIHEVKFSDYINKFKNRMMKTASNVGVGKSVSLK